MKKNSIILIGILMTVSVLGVVGLEWHWLNKAVAEKEAEFDSKVTSALHAAVSELEAEDVSYQIVSLLGNDFEFDVLQSGDSLPSFRQSYQYKVARQPEQEKLRLAENTAVVRTDTIVTNTRVIRNSGGTMVFVEENGLKEVIIDGEFGGEEDELVIEVQADEIRRKVKLIQDVAQNVLVEEISHVPDVQQRIGLLDVDSLLAANFEKTGLDQPFDFRVVMDTDSLASFGAIEGKGELDFFTMPLYPDNPNLAQLSVRFPTKNMFVLRELGWVLGMALFFSLLMIATFIHTMVTILRQKKLSDVKSDFISNMTHEFKTPLATIGLAVDSIKHPAVKSDPAQIDRFTGIISDENKRLNGHVEKILQLAKMERGQLVIKPTSINLVGAVEGAVESLGLRVASREGSIKVKASGELATVMADENHIFNVMINLIDNAIKYSPSSPEIEVEVKTEPKWVSVLVSDRGIGMPSDVQKKAFNTFYRAQTGNIHNVKGFGVGLSYVKEIIDLHGGELMLKSQVGKGTTIGFKLPIHG